MAESKKITQEQVYQKDLFNNLATSGKKAELQLKADLKAVNDLSAGLKVLLKDQEAILRQSKKGTVDATKLNEGTAAIKKADAAIKGLGDTEKEQLKIQKQLERARLSELKLQKDREKAFDKFEKTQQKEIKAAQRSKKLALDSANAFKLLTKQVNSAQSRFKRLAAQYGQTDKRTVKALATFNKLDNKLRSINNTARDGRRDVGRYGLALKGAVGGLRNFAGALGITAGLTGLIRGLGNAINIAKDFEQSNANLASVLGVSRKEVVALTEDAKRLGAATSFSATEVSSLQTEFAKLGFNQQEILNATEATLNLAAATGSDLAEAAAIAGATLGGFGLDAEETKRVTDVMAKSFSASALDLEKFKESMKDAAPAAKAVGVSVEKTTALLGTLANAGINGSKAGTALKAGFIELNAAGISLDESLEMIANSNDKLATATELVGKRSATSFLVLSDGTKDIAELEIALNNAGGAAEKMAKEQLNTLEGSLKILNSAWEGFILGLLEGDSAFNSIARSIVSTTTSLLGMLTPSQELAESWFNQRDAVQDLEKDLTPLLTRYDDLKEKTELTKDEQVELNSIIEQVAKTVPTAITEFDKYGKALDISTTAASKFIQQQKDLLALDNAAAIEEQEDAILSLNTQLKGLNATYLVQDGILKKVETNFKSGITSTIKATKEEILLFQKTGEGIKSEVALREAKIARLKGEKTELEKLVDAEKDLTDAKDTGGDGDGFSDEKESIGGLIEAQKELLAIEKLTSENTEAEIFSKNRKIAVIEKEIKRLQDLGKEKDESASKTKTNNEIELEEAKSLDDKLMSNATKQRQLETAALQAQLDEELALKKKAEEEALAFKKKLATDAIDITKQELDEKNARINEQIDKEISDRTDAINLQQQRAEQGLENTLLFEQERLAEAELAKKEQAQREEQQKRATLLAEAFLKAYIAELGKPDADSLKAGYKAAAGVLVAEGIGKTIAGSAFDGIEDTGVAGDGDYKGGKLWMLHPHERVMDRANNDKTGGMSNDNLADLAYDFRNGNLIKSTDAQQVGYKIDNTGVELAIKGMEGKLVQAINDKPIQHVNVSDLGNLIETVYKNGSKITTTHKLRNRFK